VFSQKQFHKAIANIWFNLNILETNQLNGLTVPTRPVTRGAKPPLEKFSPPWKNVLDIV